jgi:hypothetical protein
MADPQTSTHKVQKIFALLLEMTNSVLDPLKDYPDENGFVDFPQSLPSLSV